MSLRALFPVLLLSLSSTVVAQQVTLRGKVEDGPRGLVVACTDTRLIGSSQLPAFLGQHVLVQGTVAGTNPPTVSVTSIAATAEIFEIPSNPEAGGTMRFGVRHTPGARVFFYVGLASGFRPLGRAGTSFLAPGSFLATTGTIPSVGNLERSVRVPNDPRLIGQNAYAQALLLSGGQVILSNPDCKEIR